MSPDGPDAMDGRAVVRFGAGRARRYLTRADREPVNGSRPFVWVRDIGQALTFDTEKAARAYALDELGHGLFDVGYALRAAA